MCWLNTQHFILASAWNFWKLIKKSHKSTLHIKKSFSGPTVICKSHQKFLGLESLVFRMLLSLPLTLFSLPFFSLSFFFPSITIREQYHVWPLFKQRNHQNVFIVISYFKNKSGFVFFFFQKKKKENKKKTSARFCFGICYSAVWYVKLLVMLVCFFEENKKWLMWVSQEAVIIWFPVYSK